MTKLYLVTLHIGEKTGAEIEDCLKAFPKTRFHSVDKYQVTYYTKIANENVILNELEDVTGISTAGVELMELNDHHFVIVLKADGDVHFTKKDHHLASSLF
ncbi:hypothetical protein FDJ25_gp159 [Vibrio phage Aphrodite1]|uniref:Uncharacterized protein n=1 Tax=Vibrio phage Aphrodite1 TaxID=2070057 RepID=A0A2I7QI66_9CAUD|nr:hypothetical protein FDJ25_gp159 [Vibrio phage Aphrodite1]AUR81092.1 hypothetical protein Aphrodite1_0042 [Vibrio phage Aphrodite1]